MKKNLLLILVLVVCTHFTLFSQGTNCNTASAFCSGTTTYPAGVGAGSAQAGPNYGCLGSQPNPAWFYMQINNSGNIAISINSSPPRDIDFILYGPFTSPTAPCGSQLTAGNTEDCSFAGGTAPEIADITGGISGEYYLLLLTNYSNQPTNISFNQSSGSGSTSCAVLCDITGLTAVPSACAPATNAYSLSGQVTFTTPPTTGTLTVTSSCGGSQTFNAPFASPLNYTISGINSTGAACTVTASFSATSCTMTSNYTSPPNCAPCVATANNSGPVCSGSNVNLTAGTVTGATSYNWSGPGGYSAATQNPSITGAAATATGTYTVTVTTPASTCTATTTVTVNQRPTPVAGSNSPVCTGAALNLTSTPTTGGTYSWAGPGGFSSTSQNPSIPSATTAAAGTYTVTVTGAGGCTGTSTVTTTVTAALTPVAGSNSPVCSGATLNLTSTPTTGATYSWTGPGGFSSTNQNPSIISATSAASGTYTVTVTSSGGCTGTSTVTATVGTPLTLNAATTPADCFGSCDGTGTVVAAGSFGGYTYSWSNGSTTASISSLCAATYTVTVTDMSGCTSSATIQVLEPTPIALTITAVAADCGQPNGSATVVANGGTGGYTYLWANGQTTATASNLIPGSYCVTVTDANGCSDNICITVSNTPGVTATATSNPVTCNGLCDGTVTVTAATGALPYTYLWNNGQTTATATGLCPGTYTCTVTDGSGCTATASATITQPTTIVIDMIAPATICQGQSATLNANALGGHSLGGYVFDWTAPAFTGASNTVSPMVTTTYTVIATDTAGCVSNTPQTVTVTVNPALGVTASSNVSVCPGVTTTLTSIASGGDGSYTYNWMPGAGTGSSFTVTPASTTTYTITITDGCTTTPATATVTVTVLPLPVVAFTPNTTNGCEPLCVTFTDNTTIASGTITGWNWDLGNGVTSTLQNPAVNCYSAAAYDIVLTATSNGGCSTTTTVNNMITVYPQPVANFILGPQPATLEAPTINFTDLSVDAAAWSWDFGDPGNMYESNTSSQMNPSHIYGDSGSYCVTLIVASLGGCTDTVVNCLTIQPEYVFYIPNAFSPNGDGLNTIFAPKGEHIGEFTMRIFDRWGNMIFKSGSINEGWNGKASGGGLIAQEDVYVYHIEIKDKTGQRHRYVGHVTIVK